MSIQDSQTYVNLQIALSNLLENNSLLALYENTAREELLIPISYLFNTNARHNIFIANRLYDLIYGETNTQENLEAAIERENEELLLYQRYSQVATQEGYEEIASLFNGIANILLTHLFAYESTIEKIINGTLYCKPTESLWICIGCGNIISGLCAPEICPVCLVDGGFYDLLTTYE